MDQALVVELKRARLAASAEVQDIVSRHFALIQRFYSPTPEGYAGLGQLYVDHLDFRKRYDAIHAKLAEFWAAAMKLFAEQTLAKR